MCNGRPTMQHFSAHSLGNTLWRIEMSTFVYVWLVTAPTECKHQGYVQQLHTFFKRQLSQFTVRKKGLDSPYCTLTPTTCPLLGLPGLWWPTVDIMDFELYNIQSTCSGGQTTHINVRFRCNMRPHLCPLYGQPTKYNWDEWHRKWQKRLHWNSEFLGTAMPSIPPKPLLKYIV